MSAIDVSSKLGEYMLKGWVLTDEICPNEGCPVPLMRSPKSYTPSCMFCANCDGDPQISLLTSMPDKHAISSGSRPALLRHPSPSITQSSSTHSRSSTPPTDISSVLSSPTFALPVDTAETIRRRQQSDAASAEIGRRLLRGWAMLADECPNVRCYGVPLVRPPLVGGKDPRKECVACGTVYIDEKDVRGWERLVAVGPPEPLVSPAGAGHNNAEVPIVDPLDAYPSSSQAKGKAKAVKSSSSRASVRLIIRMPNDKLTQYVQALRATTTALELALHSLSQRLTSLSSSLTAIDPGAIAHTADAIGKILQTLAQVEKLRGDRLEQT
ncbi:hypothetical protein DFH11DRAFT_1502992 [Phellopilus nigrolimitatus]|nr:hypothetical protein DFH11DRAFT_1502992 [Phellopilus nigrolimitatus]